MVSDCPLAIILLVLFCLWSQPHQYKHSNCFWFNCSSSDQGAFFFLSSNPSPGKVTGPSSGEKEAVENGEGEMRSPSFVLTRSGSSFLEAPASSCHRGSAQPRAPTRLACYLPPPCYQGCMGMNKPSTFGKDDAHMLLLQNGPAIMWAKMHSSIPAVENAEEEIICSGISILGSSYIGLLPKDV